MTLNKPIICDFQNGVDYLLSKATWKDGFCFVKPRLKKIKRFVIIQMIFVFFFLLLLSVDKQYYKNNLM